MNLKKFFPLTALALLAFASCSKDQEVPTNAPSVEFESNILRHEAARASDATWDAGDAIGVSMAGAATNVKYVGAAAGASTTFTAPTDPLQYPATGNASFTAYYPYAAGVTTSSTVSLADQSKPASIDLLYATASGSIASPAKLNFKHKLSKLIFNLKPGTAGMAFDNISASMSNLPTSATLTLADGAVTSATPGNLTGLPVNGTVVTAIVAPGTHTNFEVAFTIAGKLYSHKFDSKTFESGKKYTFNVNVFEGGETSMDVVFDGSDITDWAEGEGGDIVIGGEEATITVSATELNFDAESTTAQTVTVTVEPAAEWTFTPETDENFTITKTRGTLSVAPKAANTSSQPKTLDIVISAAGAVSKTIKVTQAAAGQEPGGETELYFSLYLEGTSNNKYLQIYNPGDEAVELEGVYKILLYTNGETTPKQTYQMVGTLAPKTVLVIKNAGAVLYDGEAISSTITYFNGNDALTLVKNDVVIDAIGTIGDAADFAKDVTLRRKIEINKPNPVYTPDEWDVLPVDDPTYLGTR